MPRKNKSISTFDFTTLYTTLIKILSEVISFVFKRKTQCRIGFSNASVNWTSKGWGIQFHLISYHKMSFYHRKPSAQTTDWDTHWHRPSFVLGKPLSTFF